jgi:glucosamine--fructose-6-phosphate aminotransferase (isomerizing)
MADERSDAGHSAFADEIAAQPDQLQHMLDDPATRDAIHAAAEGIQRCNRLWLIGTGSSQHVAELGVAMLHEAGRAATWSPAMPFVDWAPVLGPKDGVIVVSHSASTAYALSARAQSFLAGLTTITVTHRGAHLPDAIGTVPRERSQAASGSFTGALLAFAMLAREIGGTWASDADLAGLPQAVSTASADPALLEVPRPERVLTIAGVGVGTVTAREGALKLREVARLPAEGVDAELLLHGAGGALGPRDRLLAIAPPQDAEGLLEGVVDAAERSGVSVSWLREPTDLPALLAQIPLAVRLQSLALRLAVEGGHDPDVVHTGPWADPALRRIGAPTD